MLGEPNLQILRDVSELTLMILSEVRTMSETVSLCPSNLCSLPLGRFNKLGITRGLEITRELEIKME